MPKRSSKKQPGRKDVNQIAAAILDRIKAETGEQPELNGKNPAAVALGRRGGLKGGRVRAERLTAEQRSEIAKKAARSRWENVPKE